MIFVDTDVPIDLLRGFAPAVAWFESLGRAKVFLSGFSALELLEGCRNRQETERLLSLLASHRIVWPAPRDFENP